MVKNYWDYYEKKFQPWLKLFSFLMQQEMKRMTGPKGSISHGFYEIRNSNNRMRNIHNPS